MFQVDPNTLYSLKELSKALDGLVSMPTFIDRLGLRDHRIFRDAVFGWEILEIAKKANSFSTKEHSVSGKTLSQLMSTRKRKTKPADSPAGKLSDNDL